MGRSIRAWNDWAQHWACITPVSFIVLFTLIVFSGGGLSEQETWMSHRSPDCCGCESVHFEFMSLHFPPLCIKHTGLRNAIWSNRSGGHCRRILHPSHPALLHVMFNHWKALNQKLNLEIIDTLYASIVNIYISTSKLHIHLKLSSSIIIQSSISPTPSPSVHLYPPIPIPLQKNIYRSSIEI